LAITNNELEKFKKIINNCIKDQAASLAILLGEPITPNILTVKEDTFSKIEQYVPAASKEVYAVYIKCEGDFKIDFIFFSPTKEVDKLIYGLVRKKLQNNPLERSSIIETGNILAGSFLNSLYSITGLQTRQSLPGLCIDLLMPLLEVPIADIAKSSDKVILVDIGFDSKSGIKIHGLLILDEKGAGKILDSAGRRQK
jgi:chemotaxis protein CheC